MVLWGEWRLERQYPVNIRCTGNITGGTFSALGITTRFRYSKDPFVLEVYIGTRSSDT